jgi:hypothetical protein
MNNVNHGIITSAVEERRRELDSRSADQYDSCLL